MPGVLPRWLPNLHHHKRGLVFILHLHWRSIIDFFDFVRVLDMRIMSDWILSVHDDWHERLSELYMCSIDPDPSCGCSNKHFDLCAYYYHDMVSDPSMCALPDQLHSFDEDGTCGVMPRLLWDMSPTCHLDQAMSHPRMHRLSFGIHSVDKTTHFYTMPGLLRDLRTHQHQHHHFQTSYLDHVDDDDLLPWNDL